MSKYKATKAEVQTTKLNHVVDTENEFATEFGEEPYGGQARVAFKQHQSHQNQQQNQQSSK